MDKKEAKKLIANFTRNLPLSAMALCYLLEKGSTQVTETIEEDYSAAVDAEIARAEANGGIYLLSKEAALKVFCYAKELATVEPLDLIALLGNGVFSEHYLKMTKGLVPLASAEAKAEYREYRCPECGHEWLEDCDASDYPVYCPGCGNELNQ